MADVTVLDLCCDGINYMKHLKFFAFFLEFGFTCKECIQLLKAILPNFVSASVIHKQKLLCICKFM